MPTLRVVPDLPGDPDDVALTAVAPDADIASESVQAFRWFACADPAVGGAVRAYVLTALNVWAVDTDTIADAMVMVSELVTNVRDHTESSDLAVRVRASGDRIVVAVVERVGSEAPVDGRLRAGIGAGDDADLPLHDRGRGLRILDSMASEWGFVRRDGVTTTWFALPATSPVAPGREPDIRRF